MKRKYIKFLSVLFIVGPMSLVMAFAGVVRIYGLNEGWYMKLISTWTIMFPVAYLSAFVFLPIAQKMTRICEAKIKD